MTSFARLSLALALASALAACGGGAPAPASPEAGYCAIARAPRLDGCGPGETPERVGAWWSCSALTEPDARALAAERIKFLETCGAS